MLEGNPHVMQEHADSRSRARHRGMVAKHADSSAHSTHQVTSQVHLHTW